VLWLAARAVVPAVAQVPEAARRIVIAAPLIAISLLAPASVGVGIGGNPVCLGVVAQPSHSYSLGNVYVTDTGSGSEAVSLHAETPFNGLKGLHFPESWVTFGYPKLLGIIGQSSVNLNPGTGPGTAADVPATLNVAPDAKPGEYAADLVAGTVASPSPGGGGQAVFGAGAETNLLFTVGPGGKPPSCAPDPVVTPDPKVPASAYGPASAASSSPDRGYAIEAVIALAVIAVWRARRRRSRRAA
jgi:hypothetical protein